MLEPMTDVERHIEVLIRMEDAEVERVCEQALQGGKYGVKIVRDFHRMLSVQVSEEVPYGQIHVHMES